MSKAKSKAKPKVSSQAVTKVDITLHGNDYMVACGAGEEKKLAELVKFVNKKMDEVSVTGINATENRLFMLTCLMLADELVETKKAVKKLRKDDEGLMVAAVDHLRERVDSISDAVGK